MVLFEKPPIIDENANSTQMEVQALLRTPKTPISLDPLPQTALTWH